LKIAALASHEDLAAERDRLAWLQGRLPVPEVLHYTEHEGHAFLLLSEVQGLPAHQALLEQEPLRRVELLSAKGVMGFVDWGLAGVADRHRDLALAADSVRFNLGEAYVDYFLQSYGLEHVNPACTRYYFLLDLFFTHVDTRSPRPSAREDG